MTKIVIELENCADCPFSIVKPYPTSDSWEEADSYYCSKTNNRKIAEYIERLSEMPEVPEWCPHRLYITVGEHIGN